MSLDLINPYVLRILISCRKEDSISAISKRIDLSYGWTYKWVQELAKEGTLTLTRMNIYLNEYDEFYKKTLNYLLNTFQKSPMFYYEVLNLFGVKYCFTATDSVYIWTKGSYNIARYKEYYPVFIKVKSTDRKLFEWYCKKLKLNVNKKSGIFYSISYLDDFEFEHCDSIPVDSLKSSIKFMEKNIYNFEPALEIIKELYSKKIKIKYKEMMTNV